MIAKLDKVVLKVIRSELDAAIATVASKHGIALRIGSARFDESSATFKLEVAVKRVDGTVISRERADFTRYADMYNLDPAWLDGIFQLNGQTFKITGLAVKRRKRPVNASDPTGKGYIFSVETIKQLMGKS
jgi:hypothetical protein